MDWILLEFLIPKEMVFNKNINTKDKAVTKCKSI